jgi:hypothetical protein
MKKIIAFCLTIPIISLYPAPKGADFLIQVERKQVPVSEKHKIIRSSGMLHREDVKCDNIGGWHEKYAVQRSGPKAWGF